LEVAKAIWRLGSASVGQIFEALSAEREIDYTTVQTYIRRLESKGYLKVKRIGRNKIYSPKVRPGQVIKETVDDLVDRVFDGEVIPLVRHLIQDRTVNAEQLGELRRLIQDLEAESDDASAE
jgi:predicted transcriptional regulator